jgi:hypothetical protein
MPLPLTALALATQLIVATADKVPDLDMGPTCRAGANSGIVVRPNIDGCLGSEAKARDQLVRDWATFAAADKTRCVEMTKMGGPPSYVELLTCMEMAAGARKIPDENTGIAPRRR